MTRIAVFASGAGTNAANIISYFHAHRAIGIALIVSNNPQAGVLNVAKRAGIPTLLLTRKDFAEDAPVLAELHRQRIDFIVLAGFLWKIPGPIISAYPNSIVNIHPALLPSYGGSGMYGINVHKAVIRAGEKESGITIHFVDEHYDNGDIIFQEKCPVLPDDTPETLAERIHGLEYAHLPRVVEQVVQSRKNANR